MASSASDPRVQLALDERRQATHAGGKALRPDLAYHVRLGRARRQLDRHGQLGQLLRPPVALADGAILDDLDALDVLGGLLALLLPLLGQLLLSRHDVVRL